MKRRYVVLSMKTLSRSLVRLLRLFAAGIVLVGVALAARPLVGDWIKHRPSRLIESYPNAAIRYETVSDGLTIWRVCPSRTPPCFIVGTGDDEAVVGGSELFHRLSRSQMSPSQLAHLAARVW